MKVSEFNKRKIYSECSGLTAIVDENIKIKLNKYGLYEETTTKEDNYLLNKKVKLVSPYLNQVTNESKIGAKLYSNIEEIYFDERLGYFKSLYAGYVVEDDYRSNSSSGGMGTWIFKELLEKNLIDGVIHVKKSTDNKKILFKYDISRNIEEIKEGAGTKYYPVELSEAIEKMKEAPGRYAIIGIPSFIMAIRLLALQDEIVNSSIKFTVGLICGHQKSSKFTESLAWQAGIVPGKLLDVNYRKKLLDREANNYGVELTGEVNGEVVTITKPTSEFYGQNWGQGHFKQLSSDFTDDVMNETADITIGDAWLPEYTKDSKGNNVVIVRNEIIDNLIKDGIRDNKLRLDRIDKETIFKSQAAHYRHTRDELEYRLYLKDKANEWRPLKRVKPSGKTPKLRRKIQDLRMLISVNSHIAYEEAILKGDFNHYIQEMEVETKKYHKLYKKLRYKEYNARIIIKKILSKVVK